MGEYNHIKRKLLIAGTMLVGTYCAMDIAAKKRREAANIDEGNPYFNAINNKQESQCKRNKCKIRNYEKNIKPVVDKALSFIGLVVLSPLFGFISLAIYIDDPGSVFFTQKRVGRDKHFFALHKFRSMKMSTPHDVPTHLLKNPDQYITRVGRVLRKTSLDELPQIWDIFRGKMSIVGPRPALWNQEDLVVERDKYGANHVMPGLTGLAQISGRDKLEIPEKAAIDGTYTEVLKKGGIAAILQDFHCLTGTISSVLRREGVVEGGTGNIYMQSISGQAESYQKNLRNTLQEKRILKIEEVDPSDVGFEDFGYKKSFSVNKEACKKVLITGANSYIGDSFKAYAKIHYPNISIDIIDMRDGLWKEYDFSPYDAVFHVAGIAHADVGSVSDTEKHKYYAINRDLAIETAKLARESGVKQFILMSSMIIYGDSAPYGKKKVIDEYTVPSPANFYGDSKWQADKGVRALQREGFKVAVLRPPMIYGVGSKGNFLILVRLVKMLPVFPDIHNERSMLYIDNLCEFVSLLILSGESGIYFPQDSTYVKTSEMVRKIASVSGKKMWITRLFNPVVYVASYVPGKISGMNNKAFGNCVYSHQLSDYENLDYQIIKPGSSMSCKEENKRKTALIVASVASMIYQFNISNIKILLELGYDVDVAANFISGNTCTDKNIEELLRLLDEMKVDCYQVDFDRKVTDMKAVLRAFCQLDNVIKGTATPINHIRHHQINMQEGHVYTFVHSHSPIGGAIGRIVAKKHHIKTIYTAHGFHFYKGAPTKNWLVFYPIEKVLSRITDIMITITMEDYRQAKKKLKAGKTEYIPGIGVDIEKFLKVAIDRDVKRTQLGVKANDIMLLSVGELNKNKNHKVVIEALGEMERLKPGACCLHYFIAGKGELYDKLFRLAGSLQVNLHLLGFRDDVPELLKAADIFVLPSIREGLNVSLMEAMASGLPCMVSDIRGNRELVDASSGYLVKNYRSKIDWRERLSEALLKNDDKYQFQLKVADTKKIETISSYMVNDKIRKLYGNL